MPDVYGQGGIYLPIGLLAALATSSLRLWFYGVRPIYGATRFLHLAGMAGFLGLLLLIEVRRLGFFPKSSMDLMRRPVFVLMNTAFVVTVLTGVALFLYDPIGVGLHTMFLPKLILIVAGIVHAYWIERLPVMNRPQWRRGSALAALAIWLTVIGFSTWNAVERPLNPADIHRAEPHR
ncbi:MAG: hypothetical protein JO001_17140 [Alphaproteobacteria bacterium]|nr:hypothetical protein [Alphaproteobacteria bacterium]